MHQLDYWRVCRDRHPCHPPESQLSESRQESPLRCGMDADAPPDAHATLVVVGPGEAEQHYAFDALIDDTDGRFFTICLLQL